MNPGADRYPTLQAPFPWFGGKSRVAADVWRRFGDVPNFVEPFFGSGAVLLGRPTAPRTETVNDKDALLANFWRAVRAEPDQVAEYANWPVNEADQHARHLWLVRQKDELNDRVSADPDYYDIKIAGWWVWGINCWIGGGWCSGDGPWTEVDGKLVHLGGQGRGVHRSLVHLGGQGRGVHRKREPLYEWMQALADRLRYVRVCCGEWDRVLGPSVTFKNGLTGVFLDPPYSGEVNRDPSLYRVDDMEVAHRVRAWALENGDNSLLRIALCGYEGERDLPGWTVLHWKTKGGYGNQGEGRGRENSKREVVWFNKSCLQTDLFSWAEAER